METNILEYNAKLKKLTFEEINFSLFSTEKVKPVFYDGQLKPEPDTLGFRDMLLEVFSDEAGISVLKINLFLTPNQPEFDGLGFLYLENKTILPVKLNPSNNFQAWAEHITEKEISGDTKKQDWLLSYSPDDCSMKGMAHEWEGKSYAIKDYEVYKETGKFLFDNSPKKFNLKQIASKKNNYLKKYINTTGQDLDPAETIESFNKLVNSCKAKVNPALENVEFYFDSFQGISGYELPSELKTIYKSSNGVNLPEKAYRFLGADEIITEWKSWKMIFDDWLLDELQMHESDGQKSLPMYITPYWIPFMSDGTGNYIAVDYAPGKKGLSGQIIVFGADEDKTTVLAENLNLFLDNFPL